MPDGIEVEYATEVWSRKLSAYIAAMGNTLIEGLDEEWPLLMRQVINYTPPFQSGGAAGASDYSVGRAAVARDVYKTMVPFDPAEVRSKALADVIRKKDYTAFNIVAERASGRMKGAYAVAFDPTIHTRQRNPTTGRVEGKTTPFTMIGSDASLLNKYVRDQQSHVGYARSGWAAAYNLVRDPEGYSLPQWVTKHGEQAGGVIDDRGNVDEPSITGRNWSPWAARPGETERITSAAYGQRALLIVAKMATKARLAATQAEIETVAA